MFDMGMIVCVNKGWVHELPWPSSWLSFSQRSFASGLEHDLLDLPRPALAYPVWNHIVCLRTNEPTIV